MACEGCLWVCFVGLVVGRTCVWYLVSSHIYKIWANRGKNVWWMLKSHQLGVAMEGGSFHREGRFSLCNTAVLWIFNASFTGYILWKVLLDTSFHYTTVVLRLWGWQSQKCNSKYPNTMSFWYKHLYPYSLERIHLLQLKIHIWMEFFGNQKFLCIFQ